MKYIDKQYYDRQFLLVVDDDRGIQQDEIDVFTRFNLPQSITFGTGRLEKNVLYVAHPAQSGLYIPYNDHEKAFFIDKMDELVLLLQALGATDVEIERRSGMSIYEFNRKASSSGGEASYKVFGGSGSFDRETSSSQFSKSNAGYRLRIKSNPMIYPFVPDNLFWMALNPQWKRMVQQRMLGLEEYTLELSSSYDHSVSEKKRVKLEASLRICLFSAHGSHSSETETKLSKNEETVWKINVRFKPLSDYNSTQGNSTATQSAGTRVFTDNKSVYSEHCKNLIPSSGKVDSVLRIELNRLRESLNLSAQEAKEIEDSVRPKKKSWLWPFK